MLFYLIPLWRHTIRVVEVDQATRTLRSHEQGGILRAWNHTLHVEPADGQRCRCSDTVDIDAGPWTGLVATPPCGSTATGSAAGTGSSATTCYRPDPLQPPADT